MIDFTPYHYLRCQLFESKLNKHRRLFCKQPYMYLLIRYSTCHNNIVVVGIADGDDFDECRTLYDIQYTQLHELVNRLHDYEYTQINSISDVYYLIDELSSNL